MIYLKVIDFSHLGILDVCILVLFAVMIAQKIYNHFRRS